MNNKMNLSLNTLNTAGLQFYLGLPFLLLVRVMKRQMIGNLINDIVTSVGSLPFTYH